MRYLFVVLLLVGCEAAGPQAEDPEFEAHYSIESREVGKGNDGIVVTGLKNSDTIGMERDIDLPWEGFQAPAKVGDTFTIKLEDEGGETFVNIYIAVNGQRMNVYNLANASQNDTDISWSFTFTERHAEALRD